MNEDNNVITMDCESVAVLSQTRLSVSGANRTDKRDEPFHIFRLVVKTEADLRITDKAPVTQFLQRALADSQLPTNLFAREPLAEPFGIPLALQGGDLLHEGIRLCHHFLEGLFLDRYYFHIQNDF